MVVRSSADVGFLLIGGRDVLSAPFTEITEDRQRIIEQVDGLGDATDKWKGVGQTIFEMGQNGWYNSGVGTWHEALEKADPQVLMFAPEGNTIGLDLLALSGVRTVYNRAPARGEFHKANATYKAESGPEEMGNTRISAHHLARTMATEDTSSHDWAASSANGAAGYLGVSALTLGGFTDVTIVIRDSSDDIAFVDLITFTNVSAAPAAQRATVAGTVDRYTLTRYTFNGAGSAQSITFATGLGRI